MKKYPTGLGIYPKEMKPVSFFFFFLFRAETEIYGGSQARGWIGAVAAQQLGIWTLSVTYTTAHRNPDTQ